MLEAACQRKAEGIDVIVACADACEKESDALMEGLSIWPPRRFEVGGNAYMELDLDGILARCPQLAVVDELAHSNAPGSRHPRRFQDAEELLAAGIDVYATVNVQNLESLSDIVSQITGVKVKDAIPDRIFDRADEIVLVDLPPGELIQRLKERKVHHPGLEALEVEKFYRQGNLTALRELAMRRAAERIDDQMRSYMQSKAIAGPWPAGERILVSLSSHPLGERLVRAGRKLADELKAEWFVLFVETPGHLNMPPQNRTRINQYLALAEKMGGKVYKVSGNSVVEEVLQFCQQYNITKIVAGRARRPRWQEVFSPPVIDEIIRKSGRIGVFVVSEDQETLEGDRIRNWLPHRPLLRYLESLALVGAATWISHLTGDFIDPTNLVMIYLIAVVIAAIFLGRGPSMLASLISVVVFDFFIVNPRFSLAVADTQYLITFAGLLIVGLIISNSATLLRGQVEALQERERHTRLLNRFSQELTGAATLDQVLEITLKNFAAVSEGEIVILLPDGTRLRQKAATLRYVMNEPETAAAEWAFKNAQPAGKGTETFPSVQSLFLPLNASQGVTGILGIQSQAFQEFLAQDQRTLLGGLTNLAALAIERAKFAQDAMQAETLRAAERLQSALLNSISHQLRTPLAAITGVLTSLSESEKAGSENGKLTLQVREELIDSATQQANTLNRLVENLLAMTRLEAGIIRVNSQAGDVQDLIGAVINQMAESLASRNITLDIPPDLPAARMDAVLTAQVLVNLLENACKFSEPGSPISVIVRQQGDEIQIRVADEGIGIALEDLPHIFEKFYRGKLTNQATGTGLGLSICKGIIEAQGGRIWAENRSGRGAVLSFALPIYDDLRGEAGK